MQMVHVEDIGARKATYMEIPNQLSENMGSALKSMGITKLYSHQRGCGCVIMLDW
jgi:DEAD/DEAH box helicase domain-containing protein